MRPIKFRAWYANKMHMVCRLGLRGYSHDLWDASPVSCLSVSNKAPKIMQFTGLLDSNGKEIYEGDVVKLRNSIGLFFTCEIRIIDGCAEVYIPCPIQRDYLKCYTVNHAVEVIGNIHKNPGLLEKEIKCQII
jgi:hypothetical protein